MAGIGMKRPLATVACCVFGSVVATAASADEPMFGYLNTTDLLPKGKAQVEQWATLRGGQSEGRYSRIEGRTEAEYGLRDDLQLTGYLNYSRTTADGNGVGGLTEGLGIPPGHDPGRAFSRTRFDGVTAELVWRLVSPYLSPVGVAVLVETTIGHEERSSRARAIVQKNLRDDTVILAANLVVEAGRRARSAFSPAMTPKVSALELDAGVSYRFRPNWSAGLEYRRRAEFPGHSLSGADYTADFLGPTLHYGAQRWFLTLTALRQINGSPRSPALRAQAADGLVFGTRHTRWDGVRFRIGRTF
jgi:opacity protein-like surface antigen